MKKIKLIVKIIFIISAILFFAKNLVLAEIVQKESQGLIYYLYIPSSYDSSKQYPFIVALHWSTGRGTDMIERWQEPAEKMGYIVACPNSRNSAIWDIKVEDSGILRMIEEVELNYSINKKRVFITGFSSGGTYAYYFGITYPQIFAASAPFAGSLKWLIRESGLDLKATKKKIPIYIVHGTNDITVKVEEGYFARDELFKYGFKVVLKEIGGLDHQYPPYVSWPIIKWFDRQYTE